MGNDNYVVGDPCPECSFKMMEISKENLQRCREKNVVIRSIPKALLKKMRVYTPVCPRCDMYVLGIEDTVGVPIRDKDGQPLTVHDLGF